MASQPGDLDTARPRTVAVLGSTGSIGTQTLDVIDSAPPGAYRVVALGAHASVDELARQAHRYRPEVVALADQDRAAELAALLPAGTALEAGPDALAMVAPTAEVVVNGVVGFAGLGVTLQTLAAGRRLALANKESLIAAGPVVQPLRSVPGAEIVPVDSEHCAIHQCLRSGDPSRELASIVLTASGGPFRGRTAEDLASVTVAEALAHPTWSMGPKITVDSSTLANKGLEVIEAHELFGVDYDRIEVVVHPQSVVHSMATFSDGATIAQLSIPDMRLPIGYALGHPHRHGVAFGAMSWAERLSLDFEPPDRRAFPCLGLAERAGTAGGTAPAWFSAANEVAVAAFLDDAIGWSEIATVIAATLDGWDGSAAHEVGDVLEADRRAREVATALVASEVSR